MWQKSRDHYQLTDQADLLNKKHELYVKMNVLQNRLSNDNLEMDKFLIQWQIMLIQILPFLYL